MIGLHHVHRFAGLIARQMHFELFVLGCHDIILNTVCKLVPVTKHVKPVKYSILGGVMILDYGYQYKHLWHDYS